MDSAKIIMKENPIHDKYTSFEFCQETANFIRSLCDEDLPKFLMIMGTGLTTIDNHIKVSKVINFCEIPHFPCSAATTHSNKFVIGTIGQKRVIVMCGRIHLYDNKSPSECIFPIRVLSLLGVKYLFITGAVGSIRPDFKVGDFVVITDHIYLPGFSGNCPLLGRNDERFGQRFVSLKECYNPLMNKHFNDCVSSIPNLPSVRSGIYCCVAGPHYETPAEIRYLRMIGCDVVGMSVVPEIVAAAHLGLKAMAVTIVTNICDDGQNVSYSQTETEELHANIPNVSRERALLLCKIAEKYFENLEEIVMN